MCCDILNISYMFFSPYCFDDHIEKNEMAGACGTYMGDRRGLFKVLVGKPEGKNNLEDPGIDGRIILRWIFRNWDVEAWTGSR